ncbi:MAG: hypothetical protein ACYDAX_05420 [Desulfobacteria bacterium]
MKRWGLFLAMLLSVTFILLPGISVAEEVAGRTVYHTQKVETMEVGDVPGHVVGVIQQPGLIFITKGQNSGEIFPRMATVSFDVVNGKGTYFGYMVANFQDGATLIYKTVGTVTPIDGGKKAAFEGTYEYVGGTGRFAGTKGKGTFKGERIGSPKTGGDSYVDFTGTEWK